MSIKTARKSATVALPTIAAPEVTVIPYAPETAPAEKVAEIHVQQAVVDAFLYAEGAVRGAAVDLFRACVRHSVAVSQFGARSDAKNRASEFNCAYKVGQMFGFKLAHEMIDDAAERTGDKRRNVLATLRKAKEFGSALKGSALKGAALDKALAKAANDAKAAAADASADFAKKSKGAQLPRIPDAASVEQFAPLALVALADMLEKMGTLTIKPRQRAKMEALAEALNEAVEVAKSLAPQE